MSMTRSQRLRADFERARQNALQWQARSKDIEKQIREAEDKEIVQAVREIVADPEELVQVLASIRAMKEPETGHQREEKQEVTEHED